MTPADFRRIALSFEGAEEGSHMGAVDFRVGGRIFATLAHVEKGYGNLMLTPEVQASSSPKRPTCSCRSPAAGDATARRTCGLPPPLRKCSPGRCAPRGGY